MLMDQTLYHGAVKGTSCKWLDPAHLSRLPLLPEYSIDKLVHFTARMSGKSDPDAPAHQQTYLCALKTRPDVDMQFGSFLAKTVWRPLINLPVAGNRIDTPQPVTLPAGNHQVAGTSRRTLPVGTHSRPDERNRKRHKATEPLKDALVAEFHAMEEKGSDVNLVAHFLDGAWKGPFDSAAVISNDTDLVTPIRMVTDELGKPVFIVCPGRWHVAPKLKQVASHERHVHDSQLRAAQFPDTIPGTAISRPAGW